MGYNSFIYLGLLVPLSLILYAVTPRKLRKYLLLFVSWVYFFLLSKKLIVYLLGTIVLVYVIGRVCEKAGEKVRKLLTTAGILILFGVLLYVKYLGFFVPGLNSVIAGTGTVLSFASVAAPIGISYYTLEAAGYLLEIRWERLAPERDFVKLALFLSFFPQIMEGPIALYKDTADQLAAGEPVREKNLYDGCLRIIWGLSKKLIVADRLNTLVAIVYGDFDVYHGLSIALGGLAYTMQLYMEFSGVMDIIIGSALLFGIRLPENFRQPFFSQSASEFWRRWHITLGTWLKTYVFYPVTTSKAVTKWNRYAKKTLKSRYLAKVGTFALTLFPVWLFNGIWHGPQWNYLVYGMYYFVLLLLEVVLEPAKASFYKKTGFKKDGRVFIALRTMRTWLIIVFGEMFFRADGLLVGLVMIKNLFTAGGEGSLALSSIFSNAQLDAADYGVIVIGTAIVLLADFFREKKVPFLEYIGGKRLPVRWLCYFAMIFALIIFGAYGTGYQQVDLIYAGF